MKTEFDKLDDITKISMVAQEIKLRVDYCLVKNAGKYDAFIQSLTDIVRQSVIQCRYER